MALLVTMETSSFLLKVILVLFSVGMVYFGEDWKIHVHRVVWVLIYVIMWSSVSTLMLVATMVSILALLLLSGCSPVKSLPIVSHHSIESEVFPLLCLSISHPIFEGIGQCVTEQDTCSQVFGKSSSIEVVDNRICDVISCIIDKMSECGGVCYAPLLIFGACATYLSHFVSSMTAYHLCVLPARLSALPDSFRT